MGNRPETHPCFFKYICIRVFFQKKIVASYLYTHKHFIFMNICNSGTKHFDSLCQKSIVFSICDSLHHSKNLNLSLSHTYTHKWQQKHLQHRKNRKEENINKKDSFLLKESLNGKQPQHPYTILSEHT